MSMTYFQYFPKIVYNFDQSRPNVDLVTNIFAKSSFLTEIVTNLSLYYPYTVQDSDTPQIIAYKYYGDSNRYWIVLLFNQMFDPYYDFPMKYDVFVEYINANYGSVQSAQNTFKYIEKTVTRTTRNSIGFLIDQENSSYVIEGDITQHYNFVTNALEPVSYPAVNYPPVVYTDGPYEVEGNFVTITTSYASKSVYDYEYELNEKRRAINLLDASYVSAVEKEFKGLMENG